MIYSARHLAKKCRKSFFDCCGLEILDAKQRSATLFRVMHHSERSCAGCVELQRALSAGDPLRRCARRRWVAVVLGKACKARSDNPCLCVRRCDELRIGEEGIDRAALGRLAIRAVRFERDRGVTGFVGVAGRCELRCTQILRRKLQRGYGVLNRMRRDGAGLNTKPKRKPPDTDSCDSGRCGGEPLRVARRVCDRIKPLHRGQRN